MERLRERVATADEALATLEKVLSGGTDQSPEIVRDSAILRFVYSFESVWKAAQLFLAKKENLEAGSPAGVIRGCWRAGILDEQETAAILKMAADRNLTVHTYYERLAIELYQRLPSHAKLLRTWVERVKAQIGQ